MIDALGITNFKAFASAEIRLGRYTLLSGLNSSGKSTVLQALALLRQTRQVGLLDSSVDHNVIEVVETGKLVLNGELVSLGTGQDVLHEDVVVEPGAEPEIGFRLMAGGKNAFERRAAYGREFDLLPLVHEHPDPVELLLRPPWQEEEEADEVLTLFNPGFQYLTADRITPAVTFPKSHQMVVMRRFLGAHGEYTVHYLREAQDEPVENPALHHPDATSYRLLDQVEAWMQVICPGVRLQTTTVEGTDLVRLGFQFNRPGEPATRYYRPTNVGFGLTYVLPTVVACLTARPNAMILLENPEAHVHPRGQTALARLTCAAAAAGAQVIVETHSDHILNGVRLSVKDSVLAPEDTVIHYFQRGSGGVEILTPVVGPDGMLSTWPDGFFDEWDHALDRLLG